MEKNKRNGGPRSPKPERGQSLVEVALLTPLLLALSIGLIELGRYAYISILVGNAARAGAAYASQSLPQSVDTGGIQTAADNDFQNNGQSTASLTVTSKTVCACDNGGKLSPDPPTTGYCDPPPTGTNSSAGTCSPGNWVVMVSVTASGTFNSLFKYPGIPSSIAVSSTSMLRVQ
jgi:Flp pilus assembly protein TadG